MKSRRLLSLDAFRGIAIAGMILVNTPGSWRYVYSPLRHADWHGWTPTDLIFPFFLFIVGVAMSFSFRKHQEAGMPIRDLHLKIIRRTLIIFGLGLLMAAYPFNIPFNLHDLRSSFQLSDIVRRFQTVRIMGVLQRIALSYFFASLAALNLRNGGRIIVAGGLLSLYWIVMKLVPIPEFGAGNLSLEGNLARFLDLSLLGPDHMYRVKGIPFDPEGLFSTLPAICTVLFGVFVGDLLRSQRNAAQKAQDLILWGFIAISLGKFLSVGFPLNKQLWTPSYTVFTAGWATLLLGVCYWVIDVRKKTAWATPFIVYGRNSIFVFVASGLLVKTIIRIKVSLSDGSTTSLYNYFYNALFVPWAGHLNGSLLFAISWILVWLGILWIFYKKAIFIKI